MKKLIINGDDYGYTEGISRGIRYAHTNGVLTSTSAMMNSSRIIHELQLAKELCPQLAVGVHLVLTVEKPLSPVKDVKSLVDKNGDFIKFHHSVLAESTSLQKKNYLGNINLKEVKKEWRFQIEEFLSTGMQIDHLDSHHNISYLNTGLFEVMLDLAELYKVAIRLPDYHKFKNVIDNKVRLDLVRHSLNSNVKLTGNNSLSRAIAVIKSIKPGVTELVSHPAFVDNDLIMKSSYVKPREKELEMLCNPYFRKIIKDNDLDLTTYSAALHTD